MTLDKLKQHTNAIMTGDIQITDNTVYIPLLMQSLEELANRVDCLGLVTKNSDFRVLRVLGDGYYIRKPKEPKLGTDLIDIDDELQYAASNLIASYVSAMKSDFYRVQAESIINSYNFKIINSNAGCEDV